MTAILRLLVISYAVLLLPSMATGQSNCPWKFRNIVQRELNATELLVNADQHLYAVRHIPGAKVGFRGLRDQAVLLVEQGVAEEEVIEPLLRLVTNPNVLVDEMGKALAATGDLKYASGGPFWAGVLEAAPTPGSSSWVKSVANATNRGYYFEAVAARNAITEGIHFLDEFGGGVYVVNRSDVIGMGVRTTTAAGETVEGDLAVAVGGAAQYIDFKARYPVDLPYSFDQLRRLRDALRDGKIQEAMYAIEAGSVPEPTWMDQLRMYNAALPPAQKIRVGTVGGF